MLLIGREVDYGCAAGWNNRCAAERERAVLLGERKV